MWSSGTIYPVLDYTWNDLEAEIVLRNLNLPDEEQQRLRSYYQKLRAEHRERINSPAPLESEEGGKAS